MKQKGIDLYIRTVSEMQVSDAKRSEMMRRFGIREPVIRPVRRRVWETVGRIAAALMIALGVGLLAGIAGRQIRRAMMPENARTEMIIMERIARYRGDVQAAPGNNSVQLFQSSRESQLSDLLSVQGYAATSEKSARQAFSDWDFIGAAVSQRAVLDYYRHCETENPALRMLDLEFDPETHLLSFLLLNTADSDMRLDLRAQLSAADAGETCILHEDEGLCWLREYLNGRWEGDALTIPAHGAAAAAIAVPAGISVTDSLVRLTLSDPDGASLLTKRFSVSAVKAALSRTEQLRLLTLVFAE